MGDRFASPSIKSNCRDSITTNISTKVKPLEDLPLMAKEVQVMVRDSLDSFVSLDANLAQTIYAGSDMLLMPSRFEPCGLSQIIAMRFGTIPIVRKTGGLADTVRDGFTGFVFKDYDKNAFLWAIRRAVDVYYNQKDHWRKMQINAMKKDFSWKASAKKYIWLYKKAIRNHKKYLEDNAKT